MICKMRIGRVGPKRGRTNHPYGFLGITVDTVKLTLGVTPDRVIEISLLVEAWLRKKKFLCVIYCHC